MSKKLAAKNSIFLHELYIINPVRVRFWLPFDTIDSLVYWFDENSVDFNSGVVCLIKDYSEEVFRIPNKHPYRVRKSWVNRSEFYSFVVVIPENVYKLMIAKIESEISSFKHFSDFYDVASTWLMKVCSYVLFPPTGNAVEREFREKRVKQTVLKGFFA